MMRRLFLPFAASLSLAACGAPEGPVVSDTDRASGAEAHPQLLAEFGGEYRGDEAAYVRQLGEKVAGAAGLDGQCTFTLVNSDVVNAFAVPGCYIYVTRGLLALVNSEAELAGVLGHEIGHIAGRHAQRQEKRALWRTIGVFAVNVLTGSESLTRIAGAAAGLFTLRYSREQEYEADELGIAYLRQSGLDPYAAADMLDALGRQERYQASTRGADAARSIPEWARTHPLSENRTKRARDIAAKTGLADDELPENPGRYLNVVDGLLYGDDPEQGFVIGRSFAHPVMRIAFDVPERFTMTNSPQAILIEGPQGMRGQFAAGPMPAGGLPRYTQAVLGQLLGGAQVAVTGSTPARINGLDALITEAVVAAQGKEMALTFAAYGAGPTAYHFVMLSDPAATAADPLYTLFGSFRTIGPEEAARLRRREIAVVTVAPGQDLGTLAGMMASSNPRGDFLLLNDRDETRPVEPGDRVKVVRFASR